MAADGDDERGRGGDPDREAILRRRNRFVAVALSGITSALGAVGCDNGPSACLRIAVDAQACLSIILDGGPPPVDAGTDAGPPDAGEEDAGPVDAGTDAGPLPCLVPPLPDAGTDDAGADDAGPDDGGADDAGTDAGPLPCLSPPAP